MNALGSSVAVEAAIVVNQRLDGRIGHSDRDGATNQNCMGLYGHGRHQPAVEACERTSVDRSARF
jgi:hypothetical protein